MPSSKVAPRRRRKASDQPLGDLTPAIAHTKMVGTALTIRDAMRDCTLSDAAISLIALRVNTGAPVAKLARGLGIDRHAAYIMLAKPQAQHLIAELARATLGDAAILAVHTSTKVMRGKDPALALRAAQDLMERAGLGISQRTTPDGATKTVFAFAFGAPQAISSPPDGTRVALADPGGPSKSGALGSGEAPPRAILEPGRGGRGASAGDPAPAILEPARDLESAKPLQPVRRRGQVSSGLKSAT
jgi:hypothetical protein